MRGYSAQFFDLSPLTVFDRPVLELGRFAVDPLQGNLRENSDVFRLAWGVVTQLKIKTMFHFCLGAVHLKARVRPHIERPFVIFTATIISRRAVGALCFMAAIL